MHVEHGPAWAVALEQSGLGEAMRTSTLLYPLANVLHVLAVCAVVAPIVLADLRLLGFGRRFALRPAVALLTAIAAGGLVVALATGIPLFAADAGPLAENPVMVAKLVLVAVGVANALLFRIVWTRRLDGWDVATPTLGRVQAGVSAGVWIAVPVAGRLIAYL
jgi:hypothetical protein